MDDGRVEFWDLTRKPHDPIIIHYPNKLKDIPRTCTLNFVFGDRYMIVLSD